MEPKEEAVACPCSNLIDRERFVKFLELSCIVPDSEAHCDVLWEAYAESLRCV